MTADDVITQVREQLSDQKEEYRFKNPELLRTLNSAMQRLAKDRPDLLLTDAGALATITDASHLTDTLTFGTDMRDALVHYSCYRQFLKDGEDTHNATMAVTHLQAYKDAVG